MDKLMYATFGTILGTLDTPKSSIVKATKLKRALRELNRSHHNTLALMVETAIELFETNLEDDNFKLIGGYTITRLNSLTTARHDIREKIRAYIGQFVSASRRDETYLIFLNYYQSACPPRHVPPHKRHSYSRRRMV